MPGCAKRLTTCIALAALAAATVFAGANLSFAQSAAPAVDARRQNSVAELDVLLEQASVSDQRARELAAEISALKKDETSVTAALIQSAKTERKLSQEISPIEDRLMEYRSQEDAIRQSLFDRRAVLSEVLAALQRMGLNPPPAILVTPQDALSSVRSAILLGAVVPQLRGETEILIADMESLSKVMVSIKAERERLLAALKNQAEEKIRLDQLVQEKKSLRASSEEALKTEKARIAELARQSKSLKELIAGLENEARETAKREELERKAAETAAAAGQEPVKPLAPTATRIAPNASFAKLKGALAVPVSGKVSVAFGGKDGNGGVSQGYTLLASPGGRVIAPADATVLFADTFRSYGNLLILDAGEGYHLVLAGMNRLDVSQNQFVLAGEPVGLMAERGASNDVAAKAPALYIEFRKDGKPVDSGPWWAGGPMGRTNNDT